jgi:hypothetical protein
MRQAQLSDQGAGELAGSRDMMLFSTLLSGGADFAGGYYRFGQLDPQPTTTAP